MTVAWIVAAMVIVIRLFYIQGIKGQDNFKKSVENSVRLKVIKASRGLILDRTGISIVRNRSAWSVGIIYNELKTKQRVTDLKKTLLKIRDKKGMLAFDNRELEKHIAKARIHRFELVRIADDVGTDVATVLMEHIDDLPGIQVLEETRREYPFGTLACHALGYMGEISEEQLENDKIEGYYLGDFVGKFGLEAQYEKSHLHGTDGLEYSMVDAYGRNYGTLEGMPIVVPVPGKDLQTTIDLKLQRIAEKAFPDSQSGAVVAIDPRNGDILAMVSSPRFDPNMFASSSVRRGRYWRQLIMDPRQPLNNRAITGLYSPGSTFKLVTAMAALNEGIVGTGDRFNSCNGGFWYGGRINKCWKKEGHGSLSMVPAVKVSCNVYFYQCGLKAGIDYLCQYARLFGFGSPTGVDLPDEKAGEVMDPQEYNTKFKSRGWVWTQGQILNASIGQSQTVTPIQLANYGGGMGRGDFLIKPRFRFSGKNGINGISPDTLHQLELHDGTKAMLLEALRAVVEPGGTGGRAKVDSIDVGGKTGTAQNPHGDDHAVFFCTAPLGSAEIAVGVVVENAGHGGSVAAPIAGKIMRAYFKRPWPGEEEE
jgi:penicillin-binding protein 2